MIIKNINRKRLWLLLTLVWCIIVLVLYGESIQSGYHKAIYAKAIQDQEKQEQEFDKCLAKNGTSRWALTSKYDKECRLYYYKVQTHCYGIWCVESIENSEIYKSCIKSREPECRHVFFATHVPSDFEYYKYRWEKFWNETVFYLSRNYSDPFTTSITLILLIPALLAFIPRASKFLISWLTTPG